MKRTIIAALVAASVALAGCADSKVIGDKTYEPYGFANENARKDPNVNYEPDFWSVVWGFVFVETIIVPVYVFGWNFMEPVSLKEVPPPPAPTPVPQS